ncbi:hypothetical protein EDD21DRAFT_361740 [Dissophora ornata]|nr:hypothetical protein BGZ58_004336 [Dissophora ornata]KAI8606133.1 hypothetical protein EDD21DRAFT_361740 [Dissophora ornata]
MSTEDLISADTVAASATPIATVGTADHSTIATTSNNTTAASTSVDTSLETLKREAVNQKIRNENRERKKRWRAQNEDRNKDNDLRCRVNKRALKMFGKEHSEIKAQWIEEEFSKRQTKRKEKERKRNPNMSQEPDSDVPMTPVGDNDRPTLSLSEQIALHASAIAAQAQAQGPGPDAQLQAATAAAAAAAQFDPTTVKTALALSDLVKKNGNHLDLAQLTGVLSDPNLARQLLELEATSAAAAAAAGAATQPVPNMLMLNTVKSESEVDSKAHMLDTDYPMDAVLTLMQLNGSWKA